jgi:hypothetical protein
MRNHRAHPPAIVTRTLGSRLSLGVETAPNIGRDAGAAWPDGGGGLCEERNPRRPWSQRSLTPQSSGAHPDSETVVDFACASQPLVYIQSRLTHQRASYWLGARSVFT